MKAHFGTGSMFSILTAMGVLAVANDAAIDTFAGRQTSTAPPAPPEQNRADSRQVRRAKERALRKHGSGRR